MIVELCGWSVRCLTCGADRREVGFRVGYAGMWANQYGACYRVFCHVCGAAHELHFRPDGSFSSRLLSMRAHVWSSEND